MLFSKGTDAQHLAANHTELLACTFLEKQGLHKKAQNFRCKMGEIDLIMQDGETIVFVEVRLRSNRQFASASESVNTKKQLKWTKAAAYYLQIHGLYDSVPCRFDLITFNKSHQPEWLKNVIN